MNRLNEKIADILKQHPEGERFFDALDAMIRGDQDILRSFLYFVSSVPGSTESKGLILSGNFGNALLSNYADVLKKSFADIILVNGGIRKGERPIIYRENLIVKRFVFLDDSFYSGTTRDAIDNELKKLGASIEKTCVIYDGSKIKQSNVYSMFRYYN